MYIEDYQSKLSCDTTCLNPDNFRFNASIELNNKKLERRDLDLSNAMTFASIAGLVVEFHRIKKGTLTIAN
jgi:hypothetical protein